MIDIITTFSQLIIFPYALLLAPFLFLINAPLHSCHAYT